jgi:hypothetical protein
MKKSLRPFAAVALAIGAAALSAGSASAAAPTGPYAPFKYCPYQNAAVTGCLLSTTTSGSFKLGTATVPITQPVVLQGGISVDGNLATTWYNAGNGGTTLSSPALNVPGGLLGLVNPGGFFGLLEAAFEAAISGANGVTAQAELAGAVQFDYLNFLIGSGTVVTLPIKVHLNNAFLGSSCYIGSTGNPITLHLTAGTTSPPPGFTPISGSQGDVTTSPDGTIANAVGNKLVDNTFPVPAATNCGYLLIDKILITAAVNLKEGLPSSAGNNVAILQGNTSIGNAPDVRASVH